MTRSKQYELLKKLKALAERGIDGEKENAKELLRKMMKKYGISSKEINEDKVVDRTLIVTMEYFELFKQVICKVFNEDYTIVSINSLPKPNVYQIICAESKFMEFVAAFEFYKGIYKRELDLFFIAFINKHDILSDKGRKTQVELSSADLQKIRNMMKQLDTVPVHKQITVGADNKA